MAATGSALIERIRLPRDGERRPSRDTGGAPPAVDPGEWYRPKQKQQDPAIDPTEPDALDAPNADHGWSNCTMSAGAVALDYHTQGAVNVWGGDLRHSGQPDLSGGTDLWDVQIAWSEYGQVLEICAGFGWDQLVADRDEGRAIILQGTGNVPGSATYDGGHAITVLPETHSDGRWLQSDPLCSGPEWVEEADLRQWAENLHELIYYARTAPHLPAQDTTGEADDVMFNIAPITTLRDVVAKDGAILYSDSKLTKRYSVVTGDTLLGFVGSVGDAHVVANGGYTNYIRRSDVLTIVANERTFE